MFADLLIVFECVLVGQNCCNYNVLFVHLFLIIYNIFVDSVFTKINTVLHTAHASR